MGDLNDISVWTGASERIEVPLGDNLSQFNQANIDVTIEMNLAEDFAFYDHLNHAVVISRNLTKQDLGYYKLNVIAVETVRNQTFTYKKEMYLFVYSAEQEEIIEPDEQVP